MTSTIETQRIMTVASSVARRFARKCWWADEDDLQGEAARAILEAARSFDPDVGIPFEAFAHKIAARAVATYLWLQSAPVSEKRYRARDLRGVHRVAISTVDVAIDEGEAPHSRLVLEDADAQTVEERIDETRLRERIRARVLELAQATHNGHLAEAVLLDGKTPRQVTAPARDVYRATELVRRKVRDDADSYYLWKGDPGED